jgi:hypothetical protein
MQGDSRIEPAATVDAIFKTKELSFPHRIVKVNADDMKSGEILRSPMVF